MRGALPRRLLLGAPALGLAALLAPGAGRAALPPQGYRFRLLREGREVGRHTVQAEPDGTVRSVVLVEVKLLSFTVFRMRHEYAERWQGDRLAGYAALTERNGSQGRVELAATAEGLRGRGPEGALALPAAAAPLAWWAPEHLPGRTLFDTATGQVLEGAPQRGREGGETLWQWAPRGMVARYDAAGRWTGFRMLGEDGSEVIYQPEG
ncbi:DUF6134 family protein [Pseudoroseomonas cervicalis]|uniref:DUF6134 family protein n=1 Tax=Teichococcus cervicalis TaxID=204525 RepID=UPI00278326B3|nr:DUF6134 family protein [Pseudoroseomonas cervicalis]MDQ1078611.1 hypothetical protein [Pseudoroseomonas cervicalis]